MIESIHGLSTGNNSRLSTACFPSTSDIKHLPQIVDIIGSHNGYYTTADVSGGGNTPFDPSAIQSMPRVAPA